MCRDCERLDCYCWQPAAAAHRRLSVGRPSLLCSAGKTTTAQMVAEASGLHYINVGDAVKQQELHSGYDEEHQAFIIDEDKVGVGCWVQEGST